MSSIVEASPSGRPKIDGTVVISGRIPKAAELRDLLGLTRSA